MAGGSMFRSAAVAEENKGRTEQEGGKSRRRAGRRAARSAARRGPTPWRRSSSRSRPVGARGRSKDDDAWFYAESREQKSRAELRNVQARARFAQAQAGGNEGISIQHRQIVKDYFMNLREGSR